MTRLTCNRKYFKDHRRCAPSHFDPVEALREKRPDIFSQFLPQWKWCHRVPTWFHPHLPREDGHPGVPPRGTSEVQILAKPFVPAERLITVKRDAMEQEWHALQELVFRLLHVDMCLGRRRSPRRGLLLVHDVQLDCLRIELLNKLLPCLCPNSRNGLQQKRSVAVPNTFVT